MQQRNSDALNARVMNVVYSVALRINLSTRWTPLDMRHSHDAGQSKSQASKRRHSGVAITQHIICIHAATFRCCVYYHIILLQQVPQCCSKLTCSQSEKEKHVKRKGLGSHFIICHFITPNPREHYQFTKECSYGFVNQENGNVVIGSKSLVSLATSILNTNLFTVFHFGRRSRLFSITVLKDKSLSAFRILSRRMTTRDRPL